MTEQYDMFPAPVPASGSLAGLKVKLDRPADHDKPCCNNVCIIKAGKGPHAGALHCAGCGRFRGWLSKSTAAWIESVIARFGAPVTPIVVRESHTYQETSPEIPELPAVVGADSGRNASAPESEK
jgi:hypothetical protein